MARTIECASIIIGKVNLGIANGEQRTVEFEERGGIGYAMIDEDEAAVLLGAIGEPEYWKPKYSVTTGDDDTTGTAAATIEKIKVAATAEEVDALTEGDERKTVQAAAEKRKKELAAQ